MHTSERGHRLYKLPYDREKAKKLEQAKNSKGAGKLIEGEFQPNGNGYTSLFVSEQSLLEHQDIIKNVDNQ